MNDVRRTGFTLMEVVVALAIAAIAMIGLLRLHMLSMAVADKADMMAQALAIAQSKIAELEAQGFPTSGTQAGFMDRNRATFQWQTQISDLVIPPTDLPGLCKVVVTVRWDHGIGRRDVCLSAILADRKPTVNAE